MNLNNILHDIADSTSLKSFFNNPIYVSIVIVLIVILMFYFILLDEDDNYLNLIKIGIYLFVPVSLLTFIHYKNIEREYELKYENKALSNAVQSVIESPKKLNELISGDMSKSDNMSKLDNII